MRKLCYPPVYGGIYAVLLSAILSTVQLDTDVASFVLAAVFWGVIYAVTLTGGWIYNKQESKLLLTLSNSLAALSFIVLLLTYYAAGLATAFIYFLITIQAARNLTLTTRRDLFFACLVSFVLILFPASASKDSAFVFFIIAYTLAIMFTFMADHIDDRLSQAKGGDKTVLSAGMNFPFNVGLISAAVIGVALTFYLFLPRPPMLGAEAFPAGGGTNYYQNTDWETETDSAGTDNTDGEQEAGAKLEIGDKGAGVVQPSRQYAGFSDEFDILNPGPSGSGAGESGESGILNEIVFYLQVDRPLYARGKVFDSFDGRVWRVGDIPRERVFSEQNTFPLDDNDTNNAVGQVYTINRHLPDTIFAAYRPALLRFPSEIIESGPDFSLRAPATLRKDTVYSVKSELQYLGTRSIGIVHPGEEMDRYLTLPDNFSERAGQVSNDVTASVGDDYARAEALENYLRNTYEYSLAMVGQEPGPNIIDEFLFETKRGHCEIFASTLAVMLRAVGIPSRLVTGYVAVRHNPITGYYEARVLDGHAWVEAYINEYGWVTFEPTPPYVLPEPKQQNVLTSIMEYLEQKQRSDMLMNNQDWSAVATRVALTLWETIKQALEVLLALLNGIAVVLWSWLRAYGVFLAIATVLLVGGGFLAYRSITRGFIADVLERLRLNRARKGSPREFIVACYVAMERTLGRRGWPRLPFWTHRDYEQGLSQTLQRLRSPLGLITDLFGLARYSTTPLDERHAKAAYSAYQAIETCATNFYRQQVRGRGSDTR